MCTTSEPSLLGKGFEQSMQRERESDGMSRRRSELRGRGKEKRGGGGGGDERRRVERMGRGML